MGGEKMKKRQTNYYLAEPVRQWVAIKAAERNISRSSFISALCEAAMAKDKRKMIKKQRE